MQINKTEAKAVIEVCNLYKDYQTAAGPFPVLKDVNLRIDNGDYGPFWLWKIHLYEYFGLLE